jgi:bacterioferritin
MGLEARHLAGAARPRLVEQLRRAHADEWHAHYNFLYVARTLAGHRAPSVITLLRELSTGALDRAERLAGRLVELGGKPAARVKDLVSFATNKPFKLPKNPTDIDGALKAVLDAQRTSLRTYSGLWRSSRSVDPITADLAARALADAARDEDALERLLGDTAPAMTGQ